MSGKKFETDIRIDNAEIVVTQCDVTGNWEVLTGAVHAGNESNLYQCKSIADYMGCYDTDLDSAFGGVLAADAMDINNIKNCKSYCRQNGMLYAAMRGSSCYCLELEDFQDDVVSRTDCDQWCPANASFCGGDTESSIYRTGSSCHCLELEDFQDDVVSRTDCDQWCPANASFCGGDTESSIYRTVASCVLISESDLTSAESYYMYSSDTCVQYCRGADQRLAFYRSPVRLCTCFAQVVTVNSSVYDPFP
ncbi:hypothetical protein PoB_001617000 [Plakobranchus ocellatus]|uniref:WSC domain-containing protein n=1 Tax=Plakobranchus ocellatus TaxID=259542 RepID=A0AAV3Z4Y8_9GAST|nr:hypothetical protein PoB_001617000 [Plakobranchus ocellatus]